MPGSHGARRAKFSPTFPQLSPFFPFFCPHVGTLERAGVREPGLEEGVMFGGKALGLMAGALIWLPGRPGKRTLGIGRRRAYQVDGAVCHYVRVWPSLKWF